MPKAAFALLGLVAWPALSIADEPRPEYFQGLKDLSVYLKPRFGTPNAWDQQFGLRARLVRSGNFSSEFSIAYDPNYPIKFDIEPKWTTGIQFAYFFTKAPVPVAIYTTPKFNLYNTWKEEFGLNFRLASTRRYYINSSVDYQMTFPYISSTKPIFQASLTLGFPLGG